MGSSQNVIRHVTLVVWNTLQTSINQFRLWREYIQPPTFDPDNSLSLEDLFNSHNPTANSNHHTSPSPFGNISSLSSEPKLPPNNTSDQPADEALNRSSYWPFSSKTVQLFMRWLYNGNTVKSDSDANSLVQNCILSPDFQVDELKGFNVCSENKRVDKELHNADFVGHFKDSSVIIDVPTGICGGPQKLFMVPGLHHRSIVLVIREMFTGRYAHLLHFTPFKLFHQFTPGEKPDKNSSEHIYGEVYTSDAFIEAYKDVQLHGEMPPSDPSCDCEKVVAALMFSSDSTHLANFGNAKAWPIYMMLGNLSKYLRSVVSSEAIQHLAYIPSLPDSFQDFVQSFHPHWRSQKTDILAHCRRELVHEVWKILLDDEFMHAYRFGILIKCIDGIVRRVYPRIFSYSADYPEKVLLATIRDKGLFPCPRCLISKSALHSLGLKDDTNTRTQGFCSYFAEKIANARHAIYNHGYAIRSVVVEAILKPFSLVPTKTLFTHLIRLLYSAGNDLVSKLDEWYHTIGTFGIGGSGIRRFSSNSSEMKKMAARDFEDLLQCAIPCFKGLLPEPHNQRLMKLLYRLAEWHALAKLRMHSDSALKLFGDLTCETGCLFHRFRDQSCSTFSTSELSREAAARQRRQMSSQCGPTGQHSSKWQAKLLNLNTIKFHFMGDYEWHICHFGTTDSYSTQLGEQCHRIVKRLYGLTNKKNAMSQIGTKYTRHQALLRTLEKQETNEIEKPEHIDKHFVISNSKAETLSLFSFVHENPSDPAKQDFIAKLKDHILGRIMDRTFNGDMHEDFSDDDHNTIQFRDGKIFRHRTMRVNYTTYDIRRDYDILNPRSHPFCMVASPNMETDPEAHPFWYAQVIGIFHAEVQHCGPRSCNFAWKPMEFLWVRWLGVEPDHVFGWHVAKLPKIGFVPTEVKEDYAFSFLNPSLVIRGCHLLPVFVGGHTTALLPYEGPTEARKDGEMDDWVNYYVNIFVDRDMFIRHLGLGVGHSPGTAATPNLTNDSGMDWSAEDEEVDKQATGPETARVAEGNGEEDAEADEVNSDSDDENASNHGDSDDDRDYSSL
ncbi:hypothetical protein AN958_10073 [Leucoagaricus sp. SymC.cos]|nr:hypothetical protein AN958_10073 [Leucoagaricus sp. SymC.cos]